MNTLSPLLPPPITTPAQHSRPTRAIDTAPTVENTPSGMPTRSEDKASGLGQKPNSAPTPNHELDFAKGVIYGALGVSPPTASYTLQERLQRIDAYAGRVVTQIKHIESGEEGESNIRFQKTRQFLEPAGYFSGGLLAAGLDPHEKITVTINAYVGKWKPEVKTNTETRTYFAWEIAAGALKHDRPAEGGLLNFQTMEIQPQDRSKINDLEALGAKLQDHWKDDIAKPMHDESGALAKRSGKADAYVVKGILQGLRNDKDIYKTLTPEGQIAVDRTLDKKGNVLIPNIYGYPMAGYAFIPYVNYHGNYDTRPNQGLMIDLKNGTVNEIGGDDDFARWAGNNREALRASFNAQDKQGGKDAHWPAAGNVLENIIEGNHAHYPGRHNFLSDKQVPVKETFNYTQSRTQSYHLKFGDLKSGIAADYQELNANNAKWADQTEVFGASQQTWKEAKELWGRTFGYVPILGNAGNIYFGVHDSIYGMTADDRVGGTAAAVISGLQLAHEIAPSVAEAGLGEPAIATRASTPRPYSWKYNEQTRDFEFVRAPETSNKTDTNATKPASTVVTPPTKTAASFPGMQEIEFRGKTYFVADKPDAWDGTAYLLRVKDPSDPTKLVSSGIIANPDETGAWKKAGLTGGGRWPWQRPESPTPSIEPKTPLMSDHFLELDGTKMRGSTTLDQYLNGEEHAYTYGVAINDNGETVPQVSWTVDENPAHATPHPTAGKSTFGTSEYSEQFIKDINRSRFTVNTPEGITLEINIPEQVRLLQQQKGATLSTAELNSVIQENIEKFEIAIPDAALRARISEVAHQWLLGAATDEFRTSRFNGTVFGSGRDPHYIIEYAGEGKTATVTGKSDFILTRLDESNGELETLTDVSVKASRTITIDTSNEIDSDGYVINPSAPTRIEITAVLD